MLVDLGRNDIGRIARFGTVEVTEYQMIHRYSRIMHICSQVEGDIRPDCDGCSAVEALLPAGTLSGAPKIRACGLDAVAFSGRRVGYIARGQRGDGPVVVVTCGSFQNIIGFRLVRVYMISDSGAGIDGGVGEHPAFAVELIGAVQQAAHHDFTGAVKWCGFLFLQQISVFTYHGASL